jgi:hypothetical protein
MKKAFKLFLTAIAIVGGLNKVEAQLLPIRVGYTALAGSFTPLWIAKELGLFERQGIQCDGLLRHSSRETERIKGRAGAGFRRKETGGPRCRERHQSAGGSSVELNCDGHGGRSIKRGMR